MFKTKYFLGALALFIIFGFGVAKAETDDAEVRSGLYYVLQNLQQKISDLSNSQTAQVRSEEPATLMQTAYVGLPPGTPGQTLYYSGTGSSTTPGWKATSNLHNDGNIITVNGPNDGGIRPLVVKDGTIAQTGVVNSGNNFFASRVMIGEYGLTNSGDGIQLRVHNNAIQLGGIVTRPTCAGNYYRGVIWLTFGTGGAPDTLSLCMKTGSTTYAWKDL